MLLNVFSPLKLSSSPLYVTSLFLFFSSGQPASHAVISISFRVRLTLERNLTIFSSMSAAVAPSTTTIRNTLSAMDSKKNSKEGSSNAWWGARVPFCVVPLLHQHLIFSCPLSYMVGAKRINKKRQREKKRQKKQKKDTNDYYSRI